MTNGAKRSEESGSTVGLDAELDNLLLKLRAYAIDSEINMMNFERALVFWNAILALSPNDNQAAANSRYCKNKIAVSNDKLRGAL